MDLKKQQEIESLAKRMRRRLLEVSLAAGASSSHFGGGLSIVDIAAVLFGSVMRHDVNKPEWGNRDRFILSKGHGCLGYYVALCEMGYFPMEDLLKFEKTGSKFLGHPVMNLKLGIEFSTGSLGMGLSLGIGVALASRKKKLDYKTFVVMGDGECNEGSVWEAAMAAAHFKLNNLVAIIDRNRFQQTGSNADIMSLGDAAAKWKSFGWNVYEVSGHNVSEIYSAIVSEPTGEQPKALIAHTVKGKGFSFSEDNNEWHHKVLTKSHYEAAIKELELPGTRI